MYVTAMPKDELMGLKEIAAYFGVDVETTYRWRMRSTTKFPEADQIISERPTWYRSTIEKWGRDTGRIVDGVVVQRVNRFA